MKAILLMIGIFLMLIITFLIIWFMTVDRVGNEDASLPTNSVEYADTNNEEVYNQLFI